jgi:histidinol dehydrogenase
MIEVIEYSDDIVSTFVTRPQFERSQLYDVIINIYDEIQSKGDAGILDYNKKFDNFNSSVIKVGKQDLTDAYQSLSDELLNALKIAKANIEKFHTAQIREEININTMNGVQCMQRSVPIEKVGLYIPGGTAPLFSTILMLAIPAKIAGCKKIILCSPPNNEGGIHKTILAVAHLCGIEDVYNVGGAQAIAAMAIGTETVPKVDKLFGPGNQYVTAAKEYASQYGVAIDMPAGPSEVLVYADETGIPEFIASDLLSQAEHGVDSHAVAVVSSRKLAEEINLALAKQVELLPRKELALQTFKNSQILVCSEKHKAFDVINTYAPEHFIIASDHSSDYIPLIKNAGSVFLGNYTPESAGDYASGTNHTLPTHGWAKSYSGVNLDTFMKKITFQSITKEGIQSLGPTIVKMAEEEQLQAHANAVKVRLNKC